VKSLSFRSLDLIRKREPGKSITTGRIKKKTQAKKNKGTGNNPVNDSNEPSVAAVRNWQCTP